MKYGLIGERLGHSFSKEIHAYLADYEYELCEIMPHKLHDFLSAKDFLGINVTIPYKQDVIPYLDWIDDAAKEIGAINTVINRDGKLYGYNTDYMGIKALIAHAGIDVRGKKAMILGSGGTSKTATVALRSLGADKILKVSRTDKNGAITYDELYEKHRDAEIIVNTTPVGMYPNIHDCAIDISKFDRLCGVIDVIYNPISTKLIQSARARGIKAQGGLYMLVAQAAAASELFLNKGQESNFDRIGKCYRQIRAKKENIVFIGMPASGKSTVGRMVAERLGRRFVDTDDLITHRIGMSISDFFKTEGEERFREIESEVIKELADESSLVIATGGGAVLKEENVSALKYNGRLYFIDRPLNSLIPTEDRPLSSDRASIERRYEERYSIYCQSCDVHISADCDAEGVRDRVLENFLNENLYH